MIYSIFLPTEPCGDNVEDKSLWEVPSKVEKVTQTSGRRDWSLKSPKLLRSALNLIFILSIGERLKSPLKNVPEKIDVYYFDHGNSAWVCPILPRETSNALHVAPGCGPAVPGIAFRDNREKIVGFRYYKTTDNHPAKFTEYLVEKTDRYANKFWAEIFGTIQVAFAFVTSFILQLYR